MRVILFIGHHKVGSTSLQDFLSRNAVALARAGILYPSVDFEGMALMLAAAITGENLEGVLPINAREPHNALAFRMLAEYEQWEMPPFHKGLPASGQMFRAIRKQVAFLDPDTVILAAEVFANFGPAKPKLINRLIAAFPKADFTVIATLRRIDNYLASWYGQRLRFGANMAPLRTGGMQEYFTSIHFDYRKMLNGWLQALPDANVILRDYGQVQAAGGSVADFMTQVDLKIPPGTAPERKTNESFHRGIYEIARMGNKALDGLQSEQLRKFLGEVTPRLDLPASGDIELFGHDNRQIMVDQFEPIQEFLGKASGVVPFFSDLQEARETRPVPELEVFRHALNGVCKRREDIEDPEIRDFLVALDAKSKVQN